MSAPDAIDISYVRDGMGVRLVGRMTLHSPASADEALQVLGALRPLLDGRPVRLDIDGTAIRPSRPPVPPTPYEPGPEPKPVAAPAPATPPLTAASPPKPKAEPPMIAFSPERVAVIARDWPTYRPSRDIVHDVNELPGLFLNLKQVTDKAKHLGLRRRAISAFAEPVARPPAPPAPAAAAMLDDDDMEPVNASMQEILTWARSEGGFLKTEGAPLPEVNAQRVAMSLPPFHLIRSGGYQNGEAA